MDDSTDQEQEPKRPTDPKLGKVIDGRYQLKELIGTGAMGTVYRALQVAVGRNVAVKILKSSLAFDPRVRARFETEARAVAKLRDPNCITLHDFGYDSHADVLYMVFDYVDGVPLSRFLGHAVPVHGALHVVLQVASALDHAHSRGILHRDLKPANIMLEVTGRGDRARVLDFGLAQIFEETSEEQDPRVTQTGEVYGSPAYMSPEQCRGEREVTSAVDIYALGCIAFELIEGHLPYEDSNPLGVLQSHQSDPIPPLLASGVPNTISELVAQMMSKVAERRPTASEVVEVLADHVHLDVSLGFALGKNVRKKPKHPTLDLERDGAEEEPPDDPATIEFDPETVEFNPDDDDVLHEDLSDVYLSSVEDEPGDENVHAGPDEAESDEDWFRQTQSVFVEMDEDEKAPTFWVPIAVIGAVVIAIVFAFTSFAPESETMAETKQPPAPQEPITTHEPEPEREPEPEPVRAQLAFELGANNVALAVANGAAAAARSRPTAPTPRRTTRPSKGSKPTKTERRPKKLEFRY